MRVDNNYRVAPMVASKPPLTLEAGARRSGAPGASSADTGATKSASAWQRALTEQAQTMLAEENAVDQALERLHAGSGLSQSDLVELQATVYAHSQRMDVATRVIDRSSAALRQLLNTQL